MYHSEEVLLLEICIGMAHTPDSLGWPSRHCLVLLLLSSKPWPEV